MAIETVTNRAKLEILNGDSPLDTATVRICYLTGAGVAGLTAAQVQDFNFLSELDAVVNVNLSTERLTLAGKTVTEDAENAEGVAFYRFATLDSDSPLISVHTTGFPQPVNGGLTVNMPSGWLRGT